MLFVRVANVVDVNTIFLDQILGVTMWFKLNSSASRVVFLSFLGTVCVIGADTSGCGALVGGNGAAIVIGTLRGGVIFFFTFAIAFAFELSEAESEDGAYCYWYWDLYCDWYWDCYWLFVLYDCNYGGHVGVRVCVGEAVVGVDADMLDNISCISTACNTSSRECGCVTANVAWREGVPNENDAVYDGNCCCEGGGEGDSVARCGNGGKICGWQILAVWCFKVQILSLHMTTSASNSSIRWCCCEITAW